MSDNPHITAKSTHRHNFHFLFTKLLNKDRNAVRYDYSSLLSPSLPALRDEVRRCFVSTFYCAEITNEKNSSITSCKQSSSRRGECEKQKERERATLTLQQTAIFGWIIFFSIATDLSKVFFSLLPLEDWNQLRPWKVASCFPFAKNVAFPTVINTPRAKAFQGKTSRSHAVSQ